MGQQLSPGTQRRKLIHLVLKYLEDRAPREIFNDDMARGLDITREQARSAVNNYLRSHPEDAEIAETRPWYYVWNGAHEAVRPVSGAPSVTTNPTTGTLRLLHIIADGEVLLQDADKNVWKATLL